MTTNTPDPALDIAALHDLTGRVAIITGGSRGIGLALAKGFGAQGAKIVISSRKADACDAAVAELTALGVEAIAVPGHMGNLNDITALVDATVDRFDAIDIVVNNAANALALPVENFTEVGWAKSFDVNLRGPAFLMQAALPHLRRSNHAAILNVISAGAFMASPYQSMYGAAKAALLAMTRSAAGEFAGDNIRVNCLAPGTVDTDMTRNTGEEAFERMRTVSPMGRMAEAHEMFPAALLLCSDAGSYITGQCILVDGGLTPAR
jgi:NAD(P)-dependent dehydrogenase (short-subunit alcohol dehydrogenase family)